MPNLRRFGRMILTGCLTIGLACVVPVASSATSGIPHLLYAGQSTSWFESESGEFSLHITNEITEYQELGSGGMPVWRTPSSSIDLHQGKITMQRNGDLVLRDHAGHVRWHTNTDGTGTNNRFVLFNGGNLAVITDGGRWVWSSGSGRTFLVTGMRLESGRSLRSRYTAETPWARLTMRTTGNLVMTYGGHWRWSSHTHVAGSRLVGRSNGNWVIVSAEGKAVWSFHTAVNARTTLSVAPAGTAAQLMIAGPKHILFERVL